MFQIESYVEAHLASVTNRVEKHGDDDKPAVSLGLEITTGNDILDRIDPTLRPSLFKRKDDQPDLPDVEQILPVLRSHSMDRVMLTTAHDGWTLNVDDGIDHTKPMVFGKVKVDKMSVEPKQGGSIVLRFRCGTSDIDARRLGKLGMHNGQSVWITLIAPKLAEGEVIDGTKGHPGAAKKGDGLFDDEPEGDDEGSDNGATEAFVEAHNSKPATKTIRRRNGPPQVVKAKAPAKKAAAKKVAAKKARKS